MNIPLRILIAVACLLATLPSQAQNTPRSLMEKLDRGLIALPAAGAGNFVSWRYLGTDDDMNTTFELLRGGESLVKDCYATNYTDATGKRTDSYQVVTFINGLPIDTTEAVKPWTNRYLKLILQRPARGANGGNYDPNDCSVGDIDGDGEYEIFVKWNPSNAKDNSQGGITDNVFIDCYKLSGQRLWRIDLGPNIRAGAHYTQFMVYDFDGDGLAEMICKTAPGSIDGAGNYVNEAATENAIKSASNTAVYRNNDGKITGGQEWLTVFSGKTGKAIHTIFYNPNRDTGYGGAASGTFNWDDRSGRTDYASYGNRGERYLAAVAHLEGPDRPASGIFSRGYYTYAYIWAVDFDGQQLRQKWLSAHASKTSYKLTTYDADGNGTTQTFTAGRATRGAGSQTMYGNGNHNLSVGDVDGDGCDEIIWGSAALDNDGRLLYATGYGHGDALHLGKMIPGRQGLQVYQVHEGSPYGWDFHDASTGEIINHSDGTADTGRGMAGDIDARYPGYEFWCASDRSPRNAVSGQTVGNGTPSMNFRVYWDGDLQDELLDGNKIDKWNEGGTSRLVTFGDLGPSSTCNGSKNTPCLQADILGDWREEVVLYRTSDAETCLAIYSTNIPTPHRVTTLMHDHIYRMGICWQNTAYNQPPHLGYYLANQDIPEMSGNEARFTFDPDETINLTFTTAGTTQISLSHHTFAGTRHEGMPDGLTYSTEGDENPVLHIMGTLKQPGNYSLVFVLTGKQNERATATVNITCRSGEQAVGVPHSWDFTQWSQPTIDNLTADANQGDDSGWSDQEYLGTSTPVDNRCFWYHSDSEAGTVKANGQVISELEGLVFSSEYCAGRSLAIAVDYASTDIGNYAGGQYLWLGINNAPYCFCIPDVIVGEPITMSVESHRSGQGRGVGIYAMDDGGNLRQIGDNFTPDTRASYTWQGWALPDGVADNGGKTDIYVKNTSGCHVYSIDAIIDSQSSSGIGQPATIDGHTHTIYNLQGQKVTAPRRGLYIIRSAEGRLQGKNGKKYLFY